MFLKTAALTTLLATSAMGQEAPAFSYSPLAKSRDQVTFMPYTADQRVSVATTMNQLLSIYVHTESKAKHYGAENPEVASKKILDQAANMTDKDFHVSMAKVVSSLRDWHTNYYLPAPHRCFAFFSGVAFTMTDGPVEDVVKNPTVVVESIRDGDIAKFSGEELKKISIGDRLITVDGMSFYEKVQSLKELHNGANDFGSARSVLTLMSAYGGTLSLAPEKDVQVFEFQKPNGQKYSVTLPWVARQSQSCMTAYKNRDVKAAAKKLSANGRITETTTGITKKDMKLRKKRTDLAIVNCRDAFNQETQSSVELDRVKMAAKETDSDIVFWTIIEGQNVGVLYLTGFVPGDDNVARCLAVIRSLLLNELKDTDALIFDIRDNGGGYISLADSIPQYFGYAIPGFARAKRAPLNDKVFTGAGMDGIWAAAYADKKAGQVFTKDVQFTSAEDANLEGMAYVKPVGIYHNAQCYSACDLMSATFQDNGLATIFSEDGTSGAGGANVVALSDYFSRYYPGLMAPLPYEGLPFGQDARVSFRQSTRVLTNKGFLIEDNGIIADQIVRPTLQDVTGKTVSSYDRIAKKLLAEAKATGKDKLYFQATPNDITASSIEKDLSFELEIQGVKTLEIRDEAGKAIIKAEYDPATKQKTTISGPHGAKKVAVRKFGLFGFDAAGKQVIETYRSVIFTVDPSHYVAVETGSKIDVSYTEAYAAIYNYSGADEQGWNVKDGKLTIGNGVQYVDNVQSEFLTHFTAKTTGPISVALKATYQTEKNYDYLYFGYKTSDGVVQWLSSTNTDNNQKVDGIDGKGEIDQTFVIEGVKGDFQIFASFVSDGGSTDVGASIQSITISA